jgi:hypothetical protein
MFRPYNAILKQHLSKDNNSLYANPKKLYD